MGYFILPTVIGVVLGAVLASSQRVQDARPFVKPVLVGAAFLACMVVTHWSIVNESRSNPYNMVFGPESAWMLALFPAILGLIAYAISHAVARRLAWGSATAPDD